MLLLKNKKKKECEPHSGRKYMTENLCLKKRNRNLIISDVMNKPRGKYLNKYLQTNC